MDDVDRMLARLAAAPLPRALDDIAHDVLDRIAAPPPPRVSLGLGIMTGIAAVTLGIVSGGLGAQVALAAPGLPLLGPDTPLAPSTLL